MKRNEGLPYVLILSVFFGTSLISSRFALRELESIAYVGLRTIVSLLCFAAAFTFTKRYSWPTSREVWRHGVVLGIIGTTIPFTFFITSLNYLSSGVAAIIGTTGPAITVVLAHFLLDDDALNARKTLGVGLAVGGAVLLSLSGETGLGDSAEFNPIGYLLIFASNISSSIGIIYARKNVRELSAIQITSVRVFTAMVITMPLAYFLGQLNLSDLTRLGVATTIYSGIISSFAGFILSLYIINRFGVSTSIMTNYMVPIVASIGGVLLLDELITVPMMLGMGIIICGIYLINRQAASISAGYRKRWNAQ